MASFEFDVTIPGDFDVILPGDFDVTLHQDIEADVVMAEPLTFEVY
jgi:hypothetical protein